MCKCHCKPRSHRRNATCCPCTDYLGSILWVPVITVIPLFQIRIKLVSNIVRQVLSRLFFKNMFVISIVIQNRNLYVSSHSYFVYEVFMLPHSSPEIPVHFPILCMYLMVPNWSSAYCIYGQHSEDNRYDYFSASKAIISCNCEAT